MKKGARWALFLALDALIIGVCFLFSTPFSFVIIDENMAMQHVTYRYLEKIDGTMRVYTKDGDVFDAQDGYRVTVPLHGVILNPPRRQAMDAFTLCLEALKNDDRAMLIYLDGFGYAAYESAMAEGLLPSLSPYTAFRASAVYPTITPVNYAAMVTGRAPKANGILSRGDHMLSCESIFDAASAFQKTAVIIEGDTQILQFSLPQVLNLDMNLSGDTDDECVAEALSQMAQNPDFIFIHLHGIDDAGHQYGPSSEETKRKIAQTNGYLEALTDGFVGRVVIVSDHGQHENGGDFDQYYTDKRGVHGAFAPSDIFVPLLILDKGE